MECGADEKVDVAYERGARADGRGPFEHGDADKRLAKLPAERREEIKVGSLAAQNYVNRFEEMPNEAGIVGGDEAHLVMADDLISIMLHGDRQDASTAMKHLKALFHRGRFQDKIKPYDGRVIREADFHLAGSGDDQGVYGVAELIFEL